MASLPAVILWQVGMDDNGWPDDGTNAGGASAVFVQEAGVNPLPGDPLSPVVNQMGDDDYYFAGTYTTVLDGSGYSAVGTVAANEIGAERAFAGVDNSLRYHFNLGTSVLGSDQLSVTFDANNLHTGQADSRYGVEVWFNGVQVGSEVVIRPADLDFDYTTPAFTLSDVNAQVGPGFDNYVELRGVNYNADGGGNWMGVDYVQLNSDPIPEPSTGLLAVIGFMSLIPVIYRRRRS